MKHPPSHGPSSEHIDPDNPRAFQNTGGALVLSFLCARGEGNVPPSLDVNTRLGCGVTHPTFSFVSCDEDSCLPGQEPKKEFSGCSLEGERTEQAAVPPNNIGSSLALNIESWTHHATVPVFLPHSSVVMITGEEYSPCSYSYFCILPDDYIILRISTEGVEKTPTQINLGQFPPGGGKARQGRKLNPAPPHPGDPLNW